MGKFGNVGKVKAGRSAAVLVWVAGAALAFGCSNDGPSSRGQEVRAAGAPRALHALQTAFPNVRVDATSKRGMRIFGTPMSTGTTTIESAERFRRDHAPALGILPDELVQQDLLGKPVSQVTPPGIGLMYDRATAKYKYWLYRYGQTKAGVPVHGGGLRTLVRNGGSNPVVWASSSLRQLGNFAPRPAMKLPAVDPAKTLRGIRAATDFVGRPLARPTRIVQMSAPKLVVFAGTETQDQAPRMAVEYAAETDGALSEWNVVADADSGEILHALSIIVFDNVTGTVSGNVTEGAKAMECAAEVPTPFPFAEIAAAGLGSTFADATGAFVVIDEGTAPVDLTSLPGGQFFDVSNVGGMTASVMQTVTPPGPASLLHNAANTDPLVLAQANGYAHANAVRKFLLGYLPSYPVIAPQVNFPVLVNQVGGFCPGNAWYDGVSINFCQGNTQFGNTSFASVNYHEYGHHIVQSGGSGQGAYGEGMSDAIAALLAGDPGLGYGFFLNQCTSPLRNADNTCQYSATACSTCGSEIHACGQLISGVIWDIRDALAITNPTTYADLVNALTLSSVPMHQGTAIDASIAVDLLTLDDDDGTIDNGTPHYTEICSGFSAHGMSCPPLLTGLSVAPATNFSAEGAVGGPFAPDSATYTIRNLGPTATIGYNVAPQAATPWLTITNGSGQLAIGDVVQVTVGIDQAAAAGLAKGPYNAILAFTNTTNGVGNTTRGAHLEVGIPMPVFTETFEEGLGSFTLGTEPTNRWHLSANTCASALPGHSTPNTMYFGVDSQCNFSTGGSSIGTATSSAISVTDTSVVKLRFRYFLQTERLAPYDRATAQISVNNGAFTIVASNNAGGQVLADGTGVWQSADVDISALVAGLPSASVQIRFGFDTIDSVANTFTGFLVDDVELRAFANACTSDTACNDSAFCNGVEHCVNGSCVAGTPVVCNDGIACTADVCNEATDACVSTPQNGACNDGNACNGAETCSATAGCQPGTPPNCNDSNACTTDACSPASGCTHTTVSCADTSECTADSCDPVLGCQNTPLPNGNACGDDGNVCTNDVCTGGACTHPNNTSPCADDGNVCTNDVCGGGACTHPNNTSPCADDGNVCTNDVCGGGACTHPNNTGPCADDANSCTNDVCSAGACTHPDNGTCAAGAFLESGGQVVIEAEHFGTRIGRASHTWDAVNNASASGGQWMQANPNNGANINTGYTTGSPQLDFRVNFLTTGTYQVWVRGQGPGTADRTVHAGIDGTGPTSADRLSGFTNALSWRKSTLDNANATINVSSAGLHTINVWMREDGFQADKILLTTSTSLTPSGAGPAESARGSTCTSAANCNDNNACTTDTCVSGLCQHVAGNNGGTCTDDGNVCTNDVCGAGVCTHPNNTATCASDNNSCTNDVCSGGVCTHPNNGTCAGPCASFCSNPVNFAGPNFQSGNLGTVATCHQTTANLAGGNCGNMVSPRTMSVNGTVMPCTGQNWSSLPAKVNGGYCITTTAGDHPWAYLTTW